MPTVLITAGPTREHLDDVRFLSNGSTGRMGYAIAAAARAAGHRVLLVSGPTHLQAPAGVELIRVTSALDMLAAVETSFPDSDIVFGAAAVADARPAERRTGKPPKAHATEMVELVPNPDIIARVGAAKGRRAVVGFALEVLDASGMAGVLSRGRRKLAAKHLDAIAVNTATAIGADDSEVVVVFADGRERRLPRQSKMASGESLLEIGLSLWRQKQ